MSEFFRSESFLAAAVWNIGLIMAAIFAAKCAQIVLVRLFSSKRIFRGELTGCLINRARRPLLWFLIFLIITMTVPVMRLSEYWLVHIQLYLRPINVIMLGWFVIGLTRGSGDWLRQHYLDRKTRDALGKRRFSTQVRLLMRIIIALITLLTAVGVAMVIPPLRQLGMSLFASAGVAGIVLGVAAKETLSNLIAGAQLALTQQILLGDEVVVNDQFGTIEEITSSYVVVRTWDLRRLVIPLRYFMENMFENWTYHEPNMYGAVLSIRIIPWISRRYVRRRSGS